MSDGGLPDGAPGMGEGGGGHIRPELVFGLVGPIGVDMDMVQSCLSEALKQVGYDPHIIHLTRLMQRLENAKASKTRGAKGYAQKIARANEIRKKSNKAILAALAVSEIVSIRKQLSGEQTNGTDDGRGDGSAVLGADPIAYIVRQLKRPEEVDLLQQVYGRKFIQISVTLEKDKRINTLKLKLAGESPNLSESDCDKQARVLIERDEEEKDNENGQRVSKIFHLGDMFVEAHGIEGVSRTIQRFIKALFGSNRISPTRQEYGAYLAKAASLRSVDLSRQVGAAILTESGDIISLGCNEVPKAGGGNYWEDDEDKARDIDRNAEANKIETHRIISDFLSTLERGKVLKKGLSAQDISAQLEDQIKEAMISDITEFGRMTHAEMSALCTASRLGLSVQNCILYVTTFPCHNCAKHIVASGISKVIFIEPYQKSRAASLHEDSIVIGSERGRKVFFTHFVGISPKRYRDIFEKSKRKSESGRINEWYEGTPLPRIEDRSGSHIAKEPYATSILLGQIK